MYIFLKKKQIRENYRCIAICSISLFIYLPTYLMPSFYVRQVPKDNPVLRVLFHTANYHNIGHNSQICIVLTASMEASGSGGSHRKKDKRTKPSNSAKQGGSGRRGRQNRLSVSQICAFRREVKDGTCLGQLTLPSSWWMPFTQQLQKRPKKGRGQPSATGGDSGPEANSAADQGIMKQPKVFVDVKYSVFETRAGASCHQDQGHGKATTPLDGKSMHGTLGSNLFSVVAFEFLYACGFTIVFWRIL